MCTRTRSRQHIRLVLICCERSRRIWNIYRIRTQKSCQSRSRRMSTPHASQDSEAWGWTFLAVMCVTHITNVFCCHTFANWWFKQTVIRAFMPLTLLCSHTLTVIANLFIYICVHESGGNSHQSHVHASVAVVVYVAGVLFVDDDCAHSIVCTFHRTNAHAHKCAQKYT